MSLRDCLSFLLLLCLWTSLQAQEAAKEPQPVQVSFSVYTWNEAQLILKGMSPDEYTGTTKQVYYHDGARWQEVDLVPGTLDKKRYTYTGFLPIRFYAKPKEGESEPKVIAEVEFTPSWNDLVFLCFPGGGGSLKVIPVDRAVSSMPAGAGRLYNLGSRPLVYQVGKDKQQVAPLDSGSFRFGNLEGYFVDVKLASRVDDEWKVGYTSRQSLSKQKRVVMLAYETKSRSGSWNVKYLSIPTPKKN